MGVLKFPKKETQVLRSAEAKNRNKPRKEASRGSAIEKDLKPVRSYHVEMRKSSNFTHVRQDKDFKLYQY